MRSPSPRTEAEQLHWLSFFALNGNAVHKEAEDAVASLPEDILHALLLLADLHHIALRVFEPLADSREPLRRDLSALRRRNTQTIAFVGTICEALEHHGCPTMAIKSTDHWPDLGNDFDLFTTGEAEIVHRVLRQQFEAATMPQSWGDRLANKWNFRVPGLTPLVEIHIGRLGQTGELKSYGEELIQHRRQRALGDTQLWIPACEDQIVLTTLQRLYRHFFYRICDFTDTLEALANPLNFEQLRLIAKRHAVWQGVATHLRLVGEYSAHYAGSSPPLPPFVRKAARFGSERLYPHAAYLRLPLFPQGATLWGSQVIKTWNRRNRAGAMRLGLLPPLAAAASAKYKVTGKQDVW